MAYGERLKQQIKDIIAKAPGVNLSERIDNSLEAIGQVNGLGPVVPSRATLFRWFKAKPYGPLNSTAARSAIAKTSDSTINSVRVMIEEAGGFISLSTLSAHTGVCRKTVAKISDARLS